MYGGRDVLARVGSRGGGMGVAKAIEGVGGGGVEGVSVFTSNSFIVGTVFRLVAVVA
jgi:hypothetical protein